MGTTGLTLTGTDGSSPAAVTVTSGTHSVETPILLGSDLIVSSSGRLTLSGDVGDGGLAKGLTLEGGGWLVLSGTNSYGGGTLVDAGTLDVTERRRFGRRFELDRRRWQRVCLRSRGYPAVTASPARWRRRFPSRARWPCWPWRFGVREFIPAFPPGHRRLGSE